MSFSKGISAFCTRAVIQASKSTNKVVEDYLTQHVILSPERPFAKYATGHLKNNWWVVIGTNAILSGDRPANPSGTDSLSNIKAVLAQNPFWGKDNVVTMTNTVSYAYRVNWLGFPKMTDPVSGWRWTGTVGPYMMTSLSLAYIKGKYA